MPIVIAAGPARTEIREHGAHVTSWMPSPGDERLFVSARSSFEPGAAIRGGVPVIFPQFSTFGPLPKHGFARTMAWDVVERSERSARLRLTDTPATRAVWPHAFVAELHVVLEAAAIEITLMIRNTGGDVLRFTAALHTYCRVRDIGDVRIGGLTGLRYRDTAAGGVERVQSDELLAISGEVDRIYLDASRPIEVHETHAPGRSLRITAEGFRDAVVWNPGAESSARLPDMEPDGYRRMICVEAAAIGTPVTVEPGQEWAGRQRLEAR